MIRDSLRLASSTIPTFIYTPTFLVTFLHLIVVCRPVVTAVTVICYIRIGTLVTTHCYDLRCTVFVTLILRTTPKSTFTI